MITLVFITDCHANHNVAIQVRPEEKPMYERFATRHGYQVAVRKPKNPTCDNCGNMTIRQTGSGNHRHCDLMGLYIPDEEMFPSCSMHTAVSKFERMMTERGRRNRHAAENTLRTKGGAA